MVSLNTLPDLLNILSSQGLIFSYLIIFVLMFLEGPIVTYLASIAAAAGYLNIWIIFLLAVFGNQVPDNLYYFIGRSIKKGLLEKVVSFFGLKKKKVYSIKKNIKKHSIKALFGFKLIPHLPVIGLILVGYFKMPYKKFFVATLVMNLLFATIFTLLGFYSALALSSFLRYLKLSEYLIPLAIILTVLFYFFIKFIYKLILKIGGK